MAELSGPLRSALAMSLVDSDCLLEWGLAFASDRVASMEFEKEFDLRLSQCLSEHRNRPSFSCRIWLACDQSVSYL